MVAGCHLSGADRIFRIGGAQAIAAMAYGTETVPAVDKIVGPGNAFVNEAKRQVFGPVGIDQLAGPSEIYVLADATGDAEMIATGPPRAGRARPADARGPHHHRRGPGRAPCWPRSSGSSRPLHRLGRRPLLGGQGRDRGGGDEAAMIAYSDRIAAEHLQVHTADPRAFALRLRNYGSLFIGELASVVYSDKCVGTNHTLPTMAAGRYTGGLWVGSYVKVATHQWLDERGRAGPWRPPPRGRARSEGLEGHRRAAQLRLDRMQGA